MDYVFHKLDIKGILQGPPYDYWYKLGWRPIKNGTYNLTFWWTLRARSQKMVGITWYQAGAHNGWGRSYDGIDIHIGLGVCTIDFWVHYNHACMAGDPFDTGDMKYSLPQEKADEYHARISKNQ